MSIVKSQIALCMQYAVEELLQDECNYTNKIFLCQRAFADEHIGSTTQLDLQQSQTPVSSYDINACDLSLRLR